MLSALPLALLCGSPVEILVRILIRILIGEPRRRAMGKARHRQFRGALKHNKNLVFLTGLCKNHIKKLVFQVFQVFQV